LGREPEWLTAAAGGTNWNKSSSQTVKSVRDWQRVRNRPNRSRGTEKKKRGPAK